MLAAAVASRKADHVFKVFKKPEQWYQQVSASQKWVYGAVLTVWNSFWRMKTLFKYVRILNTFVKKKKEEDVANMLSIYMPSVLIEADAEHCSQKARSTIQRDSHTKVDLIQ